MEQRPEQPPEGKLIADAADRLDLSIREAARRAGISYGRWRQIVTGYQNVSPGSFALVRAPAKTVAKMASVVGVTPAQLTEAGREDAAVKLADLLHPAPVTSAGSITLPPLAATASESDLLPTTEAMARAMEAHVQEVMMRVEFARRRHPGQPLTGSMVFPTNPRDARNWDSLIRDGEPEEAVIQGIAALAAWRAEKARATENGTVTEINRRART